MNLSEDNYSLAEAEITSSRIFRISTSQRLKAWHATSSLASWYEHRTFSNTFQEIQPASGNKENFTIYIPDSAWFTYCLIPAFLLASETREEKIIAAYKENFD